MVEWLLRQGVDRMVDAGCGSGRFSAAALRMDPDIELVAVDIDPLATLLARAALSVLKARRASVLQAVYMSLCRAALAPAGATLGFIGNPPYVRHHQLRP